MNFTHTEDRRMLAESLDRYVAERYGFTERMAISKSAEGFSSAQWQAFADLGVIGALFHEADGGSGGKGFDIAVVFAALGRGLVVEPFLPSAILAGSALAHAGSAAQKELLGHIISGDLVATLAHEEPDSHYDPARVQTTARKDGDAWVLDGHKAVVPLGDPAQTLIVSARAGGQGDDAQGISLFVVPADTAGLQVRGYPTIDGGRAADVRFKAVRLPADALLGQ